MNQEHLWEQGWDGHEHAQLGRWAKIPFAQKLQWLEEAHRLVLALQHSRGAQQKEKESASAST